MIYKLCVDYMTCPIRLIYSLIIHPRNLPFEKILNEPKEIRPEASKTNMGLRDIPHRYKIIQDQHF